MSAREHGIDRVARAMTSGAPGETFTARVMAPIHGVPQPGFTGRVMARVEAMPRRARSTMVRRSLGPALAAAAALVLLAALWRPGDVALPATSAPTLVTARLGEPAFVTPGPAPVVPSRMPRVARQTATEDTTPPGTPPPFVTEAVSALTSPAPVAHSSIEPLAATVPSLTKPAPLTIPPLRVDKEKPWPDSSSR